MNDDDAGMIQTAGRARLGLKPRAPVGVVGETDRQNLQGDTAPGPRIVGAVYLPMPPAPMGARIF